MFRYTWLGDSWKYPQIRSIRYPKEGSNNPNVTVYVVDLSILKFINKIQIRPPDSIKNNSYVGNMIWVSPLELSVTYTNREQTSALTIICRAPLFNCREVRTVHITVTRKKLFTIDYTLFCPSTDSYRTCHRKRMGFTVRSTNIL